MSKKSKPVLVSDDGLAAVVEFRNPFTNQLHVLSLDLTGYRQNILVTLELGLGKQEYLMEFPALGCGPRRLLFRMFRNSEMNFITKFDRREGDPGIIYVKSVVNLINKARLEMLKRSKVNV